MLLAVTVPQYDSPGPVVYPSSELHPSRVTQRHGAAEVGGARPPARSMRRRILLGSSPGEREPAEPVGSVPLVHPSTSTGADSARSSVAPTWSLA